MNDLSSSSVESLNWFVVKFISASSNDHIGSMLTRGKRSKLNDINSRVTEIVNAVQELRAFPLEVHNALIEVSHVPKFDAFTHSTSSSDDIHVAIRHIN